MSPKTKKASVLIDLEGVGVPSVERCYVADSRGAAVHDMYDLNWDRIGLQVHLTPSEMQELVARAIVAQAMPIEF